MRILVVAATAPEIEPLSAGLRRREGGPAHVAPYARGGHDVDLLTTGIGMVATAAWCSRLLALQRYDVALNIGLCGSFDPALMPGRVVHVVSDRLAEMGAEDGAAFLTMEEMQLPGADGFPFAAGRLVNPAPPSNAAIAGLDDVDGITVNTVHGDERSIAAAVARFNPQVESMEGAAFMYACLIHHVPFAQVRAVSNVVERRNRGAWRIAEALEALGKTALAIVDRA